MDNEGPQDANEDLRFVRTIFGLIGFILFLLGTFFSFMIAGESDAYYEYIMVLGFALLLGTFVFFCCLLHENKQKVSSGSQTSELLVLQRRGFHTPEEPDDYQPIQPEAEPELPLQPQPGEESGLHEIVRRHRGSVETTNSESDSDTEIQALLKIVKSGLPFGSKGKGVESKDETRCKEAGDIELHSIKAGPSNVSGMSSEVTESKLEDSASEAMSALSLSDSSNSTTQSDAKETEV